MRLGSLWVSVALCTVLESVLRVFLGTAERVWFFSDCPAATTSIERETTCATY